MKKIIIPIIIVIVLALLIGGYFLFRSKSTTGLIKTSVRFPIPIVEAGQVGYYVAQEKGYYREEGLDVTFEHSAPALGPIRAVATEINNFGMIGGLDTFLVERSRGRPLKAIAILHKNAEFIALYTLKNSGLTTVKDLAGKKVGFFYGHISQDFIRAYLKDENITVEEVGMKYYDYDRLTSGDIDAIPGFKATVLPDLEDKGIEVNIIDPADSGMLMQGYTIFVTEDFLKEKPKIIEKFLRATLRGYRDSVIDPKEAVGLLVKNDTSLSEATELKRMPYYNKPMSGDPYGYMDEQMFQVTYDRLNRLGLIITPLNIQDAFDSSFVKKVDVRGADLK